MDDFHGPHYFYGFGGPALPAWAMVAMFALSVLPWLVVPGLLVWAASRWWAMQQPRAESLIEPPPISAAELLRQRYVLGEIDATTFEEMLERVLYSETQESLAQLNAAVERGGRASRYRVYPEDAPAETQTPN
jgi:hypothetical protein